MTETRQESQSGWNHVRAALVAAWFVAVWLVWQNESARPGNRPDDQGVWLSLVANADMDTTLFIPLLAIAPLVWWKRRPEASRTDEVRSVPNCSLTGALLLSVVAGAAAFMMSQRVADMSPDPGGKGRFGSMPPAYHDEYSYLFQAETFLAGRTAFPSQGPPGLFDQMQVLNDDGVYASRYFPAPGLFLAPFVSMGKPYLGHQIANGLIAALLSFLACRSMGLMAGAIAGTCLSFAPGMTIFSNLLLAHHPALLGLSVFLVAMLEARNKAALVLSLIAGFGLTFAMLCRPMTAAGVALPFGVWILYRLVRPAESRRHFVKISVGLGTNILCGFVLLAVYNNSVTGESFTTPYSIYTDTYTPNHVYGFNNVERGTKVETAKRIAKYDGWAENLTPPLAVRNMRERLRWSFVWTLGLVPNAMLAVCCLILWPKLPFAARMLFASIASLHLVHIPYWFDGIMHYHYVFESGALWCVLAGMVLVTIARQRDVGLVSRPALWVMACVIVTITTNFRPMPNPFIANADMFPVSRVHSEISGISFSRSRYWKFQQLLADIHKPALVLIKHDPADIHIEYVNNHPALKAQVLTGQAEAWSEDLLLTEDPLADRAIYLFDPRESPDRLVPIDSTR